MASSSELKTSELKTGELEKLNFSDFCQREELEGSSFLSLVENIFAAAKNAPEPTGEALKLQARKIAVLEKNQPGAMSYLLIGSGLAALGLATAGIGPAVAGAIGGPGVVKWVNDCNASEQTAFIKAYMKVYPNASETELDEALKKYVEIQPLNIDQSE